MAADARRCVVLGDFRRLDPKAAVGERQDDFLAALPITPEFLRTPRLELDDMCRMSREAGADLLVLDAGHPVLAPEAHGRLLEQISCPVLLVR